MNVADFLLEIDSLRDEGYDSAEIAVELDLRSGEQVEQIERVRDDDEAVQALVFPPVSLADLQKFRNGLGPLTVKTSEVKHIPPPEVPGAMLERAAKDAAKLEERLLAGPPTADDSHSAYRSLMHKKTPLPPLPKSAPRVTKMELSTAGLVERLALKFAAYAGRVEPERMTERELSPFTKIAEMAVRALYSVEDDLRKAPRQELPNPDVVLV